MSILAAGGSEVAEAFVEIGTIVLVLSVLARLATWLRITAIPLFLVGGLVTGEGQLAPIEVSAEYISLTGEIGVLLLLLTLGLEYSAEELQTGLRTGARTGLIDAAANFTPGFAIGVALGWELTAALLLGGVSWVSSSGVAAKVLSDLSRLGNRETPSILNLLVIEDLAMAVYLPIVAALVAGTDATTTVKNVAIALAVVVLILALALRYGRHLSSALAGATDESLLLGIFGVTLLVGGLAQRMQVSAAIGAFLVGIALAGPVQQRASALLGPLRDLFAAVFFFYFAFAIDPADLARFLLPALVLAGLTVPGKLLVGWVGARRLGVAAPGRIRAGTALIARGEFSIVIAALGATLADGADLAALAAGYVLLTVVIGPVAARVDARRLAARISSRPRPAPT
ncbi:MAG: cation:proton antiporter [Acidimicrobiia bacterium]